MPRSPRLLPIPCAALLLAAAACTNGNGSALDAGGMAGSGSGGTSTSAGSSTGQSGGGSGTSTASGGKGGQPGYGGSTAAAGRTSVDGMPGTGGMNLPATTGGAPAGAGGRSEALPDTAAEREGGQGGRTSPPEADASDSAPARVSDGPGNDGRGDAGNDVAADTSLIGNPRRVLLSDEGNRRVVLVDLQTPGQGGWTRQLNDLVKYGDSMRDMQLVGGDRVAVSIAKGYVELDIKTGEIKKEVVSFDGVETLRRLPNGNTILGANANGGVTLQELDSQDIPVAGHKVTFTNYGQQLRLVRRTPQGTFLMGVGTKLAEVNWDKQTLWEMPIPSGDWVFQGLCLPDKSIAVTSGYGAAILIIDPTNKKVVTTMGGKGQPEAGTIAPNFYAGFQVLPNGHFVVTNWEGHGGGNGGKGLQLLEYDASGSLVWKWKQDPTLVSSLHGVIVLDGLDTAKIHDDIDGVLAPVTR